jgi:hypothetical protein
MLLYDKVVRRGAEATVILSKSAKGGCVEGWLNYIKLRLAHHDQFFIFCDSCN